MCQKHNSRWVILKDKKFRVDACIRDLVLALNRRGIETLASCCGHGKYPVTIIYRRRSSDSLNGNIYDFCSGSGIIGRERKFYKRDADGLFFIPEVGIVPSRRRSSRIKW